MIIEVTDLGVKKHVHYYTILLQELPAEDFQTFVVSKMADRIEGWGTFWKVSKVSIHPESNQAVIYMNCENYFSCRYIKQSINSLYQIVKIHGCHTSDQAADAAQPVSGK